MAQHGLHGPQVGAVVQQVRGEGVAQDVGAHGLGAEARLAGIALEEPPQVLAGEALAPLTHEQLGAFGVEARPQDQPGSQPDLGAGAEGHQALLAALARDLQEALVQEDGQGRQARQL